MVHPKKIVELALKYLKTEERGNIHININIHNNQPNNININIHGKEEKGKQNKRKQFMEVFDKKIKSSSMVQKIKVLVVGHALIRKVSD